MVERERLEEILKEHELSMSGLTDDEDTTAELGKLAGAAYVITGSFELPGPAGRNFFPVTA